MISGTTIVQSALSGVLEGGNYALYAVGLAFVFGIMRIINLAHGELLVLGGYVAYWALRIGGVDPVLALPLAALVPAGAAFAVQRALLRRIRAAADLNSLILTFGVGIFLANLFLQLWSADLRSIDVPWMQGSVGYGGVFIGAGEIAAFAVSLTGVLGLHLFLARTRTGKAVRATAADRDAAALAGIDVDRMDLLAFVVGGALAGLGGPLLGMLSHFDPGAGLAVTIKGFILTVLAGVGSIPGLIVGGIVLGVGEAATVTFVGSSCRELFGFIVFLGILVVRPSGLFGRRT